MTLNSLPSIAPHITSLLRGTKLHDISFVEHPPSKWSWHLALAMASAIMDPGTKRYWATHEGKNLQEMGTWLGQTWSRRSKNNLTAYPDIFPHAVALFETLLLRSQQALVRLYGKEGAKVAHYVAHGLMLEGMELYPQWMQSYYDMRQSIETDESLKTHIEQYVAEYPQGWTRDKEMRYQHDTESSLPHLPVHAPMETILEWFNPATMQLTPIPAVISSDSAFIEVSDNIDGVPYEALKFSKKGAVQITGLLGQLHEVSYQFDVLANPIPLAGSRTLHAHVLIENSVQLTDNTSLQEMHALTLAHAVTQSLDVWINSNLIQEHVKSVKFEPSVSVDCELRDPEANIVWLDTVQDHLQQFMQEAFNLPTPESSIRRTL